MVSNLNFVFKRILYRYTVASAAVAGLKAIVGAAAGITADGAGAGAIMTAVTAAAGGAGVRAVEAVGGAAGPATPAVLACAIAACANFSNLGGAAQVEYSLPTA
jgi:hypothetical protein